MARFSDGPRDKIDAAIDRWKARSLVGGGSLLFDDREETWSAESLDALHHAFNRNQLIGDVAGGEFSTKWRAQLEGLTDDQRLLAAEILLVHFLFASSVTKETKLAVIAISLEPTEIELPEDGEVIDALGQWIGHPGIGFNTRRDVQVAYLIDFAKRFRELGQGDQEATLADPWALRDFADESEEPIREMRHVILHLLNPESFERISSGTHKREIETAFADLLPDDAPVDVDERLLVIREQLGDFLPDGNAPGKAIDFYHPPLHGVWESTARDDKEGAGDLEALEWNKQIILYGPPGTGKTYEAARLAETLIRRAALERWGPKQFFENQDAVEKAVQENFVALQLHPGWSYEEFVRGMRLDGESTSYEPGFLPKTIDKLAGREPPEGLVSLPGVLMLDEINRTDLSALLGEGLSLLERDKRGSSVELPGVNKGEEPALLSIPEDLFVIGTMNEIDQSVESLDFALRRRFLWRECPFERDAVLTIIEHRWVADVQRFKHEDAAAQLELFADRAQALNDEIAASEELGRAYQVGHTYFADITFFLGAWLRTKKQKPMHNTFLWTRRGEPRPPAVDLWERSLRPLLEQYLAGSDLRDEQMTTLRNAFLTLPE